MNKFISFVKRKVLRLKRERWNYQYATGSWDGLKGATEHERFMATVQLFEKWKKGGSILEVGCGEAILQQKLQPDSYDYLVGIDLADVAITRAKMANLPKSNYEVADMEFYEPDERFDAIIFTESLNYAKHPAKLLQRYSYYLKPQGILIVSMFANKHIPAIWQLLEAHFEVIDHLRTANQHGTWDCRVFQLR